MCYKLSGMILAGAMVAYAVVAQATITIDTVPVGDPGNAGELSGGSAPGGYGPDRICGAVGYTYNIGKYEVTAGQYTAFLNAVAATDTYGLYNTNMWSETYGCKIYRSGSPGSYNYSVAADRADRPVNYVSWGDAARFANWLHNGQPTGAQNLSTTEDGAYSLNGAALMAVNREADWKWAIASEDEWYKAAYYDPNKPGGAGYWDYPTGTDAVPNNGNPGGDTGNTANFNDGRYTVGSPYWTTPVGWFALSQSPYGTYDQGGNILEWNEGVVYAGSQRGVRGGRWSGDSGYLLASYRGSTDPAYEDRRYIGFRVTSVPEPGSLVMLAGVALTALLYWRRKRA